MSESQEDDGGAVLFAAAFLFFMAVVVCGFGYCYYQKQRGGGKKDTQSDPERPKKDKKKYVQLSDSEGSDGDRGAGPPDDYTPQALAPIAPTRVSPAPRPVHRPPPAASAPAPSAPKTEVRASDRTGEPPKEPRAEPTITRDPEGDFTDEEDARPASKAAERKSEREAFFPGDEESSSSSGEDGESD